MTGSGLACCSATRRTPAAGTSTAWKQAVQKYYGYKHIIPTHQGRGAEHLISRAAIKPGQFIAGNMYFTTTRLHQELAGGIFVDVIIDEAHDPAHTHPFKGNVDLEKVEALDQAGRGGEDRLHQPCRHGEHGRRPAGQHGERRRPCAHFADKHGIKVYLDATRMVENAFFIQEREEGYANRSVAQILKEFCAYTDGAWMSAKKDSLVNIGGWLAVNDWTLFEELRNMVVVYEGLHTYGGLAGRDMEALAIGIVESVQDDHVRSRIGQVRYLGELLTHWGIPIVLPIGRTCDLPGRKGVLPHLRQDQFPAQTLAAELYLDSGIRSMERGIASAGTRPQDRRSLLPETRAHAADHPEARLYPGAHGCRG